MGGYWLEDFTVSDACGSGLRRRKGLMKMKGWDFPGGAVVKNLPASAGDTGSSPGPGRSHMPQSD